MSDPQYPYIACAEPGHERPEPGYAVCVHVLQGAPVADVERATTERLGVVACAECCRASKLDVNTTVCVCAYCAAKNGWLGSKELN